MTLLARRVPGTARPAPRTRSRAVAVVAGVLAVLVVAAGCARPRGADGNLVNGWAPMAAPAYTIQAVGACYSGKRDLWFYVDFYGMILVNCTESHVAEVVAVREFTSAAAPVERPTTSTVAFQTAFQDCSGAVTTYMGADWHTAKAYPVVWLPSYGAWRTGNHHYTCAVAVDPMDDPEANSWKVSVKDALHDAASPIALGCVKVAGTGVDKDGFYATITDFHSVACGEPHDGEFAGAIGAPAGKFPASAQENGRFASLCDQTARAFLGQTRAQWDKYPGIRTMWLSPTQESWNVDDRTVRCYVEIASTHLVGTSLRGLGGAPLPPKVG